MDSRALRTLALLVLALAPVCADQVIMKDGTVYKGKIMIDTDKAILIGNPPYDPTSYLLQADDIAKIIYEEYHPVPPAERKRGITIETRVTGNFYSSDISSLGPAPSIYFGAGFRVHPLVELNGGVNWTPSMHTSDPFAVSDGTSTRNYQDFWQYEAVFSLRLYPFYKQKWKTEPYFVTGYSWSHQIPKGSGDGFQGSGWHVGIGAIRPITTHLYLETRFAFQKVTYDTIDFLGQSGTISPTIDHQVYSLSVGLSYRL